MLSRTGRRLLYRELLSSFDGFSFHVNPDRRRVPFGSGTYPDGISSSVENRGEYVRGSIRNPPRGNCRAKSGLKFCRADIVNGIKGFTGGTFK